MEITRRASDALRGIAIILIVLFHAFRPAGAFGTDVLGRLGIAQIGVFLFLFVSGYGICRSYGLSNIDVKRYVEKRFWRVVVPYWAVLTLTIAGLLLFMPVYFEMAWMRSAIVLNFLLVSIWPYDILSGVGWFVTYIALWYAIYYLASRLPIGEMKKIMLMVLGVPAVVYFFSNDIEKFLLSIFPVIQVETLGFRGLYLPYAFAFPLGVLAAKRGSWKLDFGFSPLQKIGKHAYWIYLLHMELLCGLAVFGVAGYCGGWDYAIGYYHTNIGSAKFAAGDYAGALAEYELALKQDPVSQPMFYANSGRAKMALGDYAGALKDYEVALGMNATYYGVYYNYGVLKYLTGDTAGALGAFDAAIAQNASFADAYKNRGIVRANLGDWNGARADMDMAHQLEPSLPGYDAWVKSVGNAGG